MAQQVQELIEKIKSEGIQAAEEKAKEIERQAKARAEEIVRQATREAEHLVAQARQEARKIGEATTMALKQAARDTLLSLRQEIEKRLHKILALRVAEVLSGDQLGRLLTDVIKGAVSDQNKEVRICLNEQDAKALTDTVLQSFQEELKNGLTIKASGEMGSGFTMSFDQGRSAFDFSDASLAEYLGQYVNDRVAALIKESMDS